MHQVTPDMIDCWRKNYGLDKRSPEDAARWWAAHWSDMAPAGAVAALGFALQELDELRKDAERYRWLREHGDSRCTEKDGYGGQELKMGDCLDSAVDAAIAAARAVGAA